jgi:hypothetical protein
MAGWRNRAGNLFQRIRPVYFSLRVGPLLFVDRSAGSFVNTTSPAAPSASTISTEEYKRRKSLRTAFATSRSGSHCIFSYTRINPSAASSSMTPCIALWSSVSATRTSVPVAHFAISPQIFGLAKQGGTLCRNVTFHHLQWRWWPRLLRL